MLKALWCLGKSQGRRLKIAWNGQRPWDTSSLHVLRIRNSDGDLTATVSLSVRSKGTHLNSNVWKLTMFLLLLLFFTKAYDFPTYSLWGLCPLWYTTTWLSEDHIVAKGMLYTLLDGSFPYGPVTYKKYRHPHAIFFHLQTANKWMILVGME